MAKSKDELVKDAKKLGIELTGDEKVSDLLELIEKASGDKGDKGEGEAPKLSELKAKAEELEITLKGDESAEDIEALIGQKEKASGKKGAKVDNSNGVSVLFGNIFVREFTEDDHGEDFETVAQDFVDAQAIKKPKATLSLVPSDSIASLIVKYREKEDAEKPIDKQDPDKPFVDKEKRFTVKSEAVAFNIAKKGTIVVGK